MKNRKCILKKRGKGLKIGLVTALSALTFFSGCSATSFYQSLTQYSSETQITSIAKELNCDTSYIRTHNDKFLRLQHNGDEPVYVCFSSNFGEVDKQCAVKSLDYLFGLVGEINDKYKYEIVDQNQYDKLTTETTIYYDVGDYPVHTDIPKNGFIRSDVNLLSFLTSNRVLNDNKIYRSTDYNPEKISDLEYVYTHELLHAFGIDDVYISESQPKKYCNTFINAEIGEKVSMVTPNDYKCLISLYAEEFKSAKEQSESINKYKTMVKEYEEKYYQTYFDVLNENYNINKSIEMDDFVWKGSIFSVEKTSEGFKDVVYNYELEVEDDKYSFKILDDKKNVLDSCEGESIKSNGVVFLKDVELNEGLIPKNQDKKDAFIKDFALAVNNDKATLMNATDLTFIYGMLHEVEIENEL